MSPLRRPKNARTTSSVPTSVNSRQTSGGGEPRPEDDSSVTLDGSCGWGCVVVLASFMMHVFTDGFTFSFGIFVEDFVDYFESSKSVVGGIGSVMIGVWWFSGM